MRRPLSWLALGAAFCGCPAPLLQGDAGGPAGGETAAGGNGANGSEAGQGGGSLDCSTLDDACNIGMLLDGRCVAEPLADGLRCDDGLSCTYGETCEDGACTGGLPPSCLTPDLCHVVSCNETSGQCEIVPGNDGNPCNGDGNACTTVDTCLAGECVGAGPEPDCSDLDSECSVGACQPELGCVAEPWNDLSLCTSDDDQCTEDLCWGGSCQHLLNVGLACEDQNPCSASSVCNDGNTCVPLLILADGTPCEQSFCQIDEVCTGGGCGGTPRLDCPVPVDSCLWTDFNCDIEGTSTGGCVASPMLMWGAGCDDACKAEGGCNNGFCDGGVAANEGAACEDNNACTTSEACSAGVCDGVTLTTCASGDGCCPWGCTSGSDADCTAVVYLVSGNGGNGFFAFDLEANTWSTLPDPPVATRHRLASDGHSVFLLGVDRYVYRYDPALVVWALHRNGPSQHLPPISVARTGLFAWTSRGLVVGLPQELSDSLLLRESGPAWGLIFMPNGLLGPSTFDSVGGRLFATSENFGLASLDLASGQPFVIGGIATQAPRGGSYFEGWFYWPIDDGMGGATLYAQNVDSGIISNTTLTLDDPSLDTDVDPATGDIYFAPSQPTGSFQVLHTSTMTLEPLPPPPMLPADWAPVIVVARAPSQ